MRFLYSKNRHNTRLPGLFCWKNQVETRFFTVYYPCTKPCRARCEYNKKTGEHCFKRRQMRLLDSTDSVCAIEVVAYFSKPLLN
jgi:hypothetical protein